MAVMTKRSLGLASSSIPESLRSGVLLNKRGLKVSSRHGESLGAPSTSCKTRVKGTKSNIIASLSQRRTSV